MNIKETYSRLLAEYNKGKESTRAHYLDLGENPDLLSLALISNDLQSVDELLASGWSIPASFPAKLIQPVRKESGGRDVECNLLFPAIFSGLSAVVQKALELTKDDLLFRGKEGGPTVLHIAVMEGNYSVLELLLKGAERKGVRRELINVMDGTRQEVYSAWAEENNDDESAEAWVERCAGVTPLELAISLKQEAMAELLIKYGACVHPFAEDISEHCPLSLAAENNMTQTVKLLLEKGAAPSPRIHHEITPLSSAISHKNVDMVRMLVEAGAEINKNSYFEKTPIIEALAAGDTQIFDILLSHGCDGSSSYTLDDDRMVSQFIRRMENPPKLPSEERSWYVEHRAACFADDSKLKMLNPAEWDFNRQEKSAGLTPLHVAAFGGKAANVEYLLTHGADMNIRTFDGRTCLQLCEQGWQAATEKFLKRLTEEKGSQEKGNKFFKDMKDILDQLRENFRRTREILLQFGAESEE